MTVTYSHANCWPCGLALHPSITEKSWSDHSLQGPVGSYSLISDFISSCSPHFIPSCHHIGPLAMSWVSSIFALHIRSAWTALSPDTHVLKFLTIFHSLLKFYLLSVPVLHFLKLQSPPPCPTYSHIPNITDNPCLSLLFLYSEALTVNYDYCLLSFSPS